jgi:hypothetical protein
MSSPSAKFFPSKNEKAQQMKPTLITVLLINFACISRVLSSGSTHHHDEGLPISARELDAVVAAGCGQTPSSNGNNNSTY